MNIRITLATLVCIVCTGSAGAAPAENPKDFCQALLKTMTNQAIDRNEQLHDQTSKMIAELEGEKGEVWVLASWVFRGVQSFTDTMRVPLEAQNAKVQILVDLSSHSVLQRPALGKQSAILETFVFKAPKENLLKLFTTLRETPELNLVTYEFLHNISTRSSPEFTTYQAVSVADRAAVLKQAIRESSQRLVVFNDVRSKSFLAIIDPATFEGFLQQAHRSPKVLPIEEESLVRLWNEQAPKVIPGGDVLLINEVNKPVAYLAPLNDLAEIQALRASQFVSYQKLTDIIARARGGVIPPSLPPSGKREVYADLGGPAQQFEWVSITRSEFLVDRKAYFGPKGKYRLSAKRPVFQVRLRTTPDYVGFLPSWLKTAPMAEILAAYRRFAELPPEAPLPEQVPKLIASCQFAKSNDAAARFHVESLSNAMSQTMFTLFQSGQPLILEPAKRVKNPDPMSFVLFPVDFSKQTKSRSR